MGKIAVVTSTAATIALNLKVHKLTHHNRLDKSKTVNDQAKQKYGQDLRRKP